MKNEDAVVIEKEEITQNEVSKATETSENTSNGNEVELKDSENELINNMEMITLGSNNDIFMTTQSPLHGQAIFSSKDLPQFLQETLDESLSKITISEEKTVDFVSYTSEECLPDLMALITKDLSEPYSIYTYRYFLHNWPQLSFLAYCKTECVGAIVCKLDQHRKDIWRGYIAMLVVHKDYRRYKIGTKLVQKAIRKMIEQGCDEVVLETEVTNKGALTLYENLGFVRDKRLLRYYLNGVDAWRLKLWLV